MFSKMYFCKLHAAQQMFFREFNFQLPLMQPKQEPQQHLKGHTFLIIHLLNRCRMGMEMSAGRGSVLHSAESAQ